MCRHEYASYACGHHRDLGHFCSNAQSAALPSKVHCTQYVPLPEMHYSTQCGRRNGFYCGETQDGRLIDTFQDAMDRMKIEAAMRKSEAESSKLQCANCVSEAKTRGVPTEDLQTLPTYVMLKQRHDAAMVRYTVLCGKYKVLLPIVDYAHKNRNLLEPGVRYQPFWNGTSFDFKNTIFPMQLLQPIFHILPGYNPAQTPQTIPPGGTAVNLQQDSYVTNNMSTGSGLDSEPAVGHKSAPSQRPKLTVSTTSNQPVFIRQVVSVTEQGSPVSHSKVRPKVMTPIRGETPEGEAHTEKAVRYLKQLEVEGEKYVAKAMTDAGYDVARYGIRPLPKMGHRRQAQPKPTLPNTKVTKASSKKKGRQPTKAEDLAPTPSNVRRSARTQNNKPKYVDASENSSSLGETIPNKSDAAWDDILDKSDGAYVESPPMSEASASPVKAARGTVGRNKQANMAGSPSGSPHPNQVSLSSKIRDYQQGATPVPRNGSPQTPYGANMFNQSAQPFKGSNSTKMAGKQRTASRGSPSTRLGVQELPSSHTPHQRRASMQQSAQLLQELDRSLRQHQLASGIVSNSPADMASFQQHAMPTGMPYAPNAMQAQMPANMMGSQQHAMSHMRYAPQAMQSQMPTNAVNSPQHSMSPRMLYPSQTMQPPASRANSHTPAPQSGGQNCSDSPGSSANFFHHGYHQPMASTARPSSSPLLGQRSFSTSSVPTSMLPPQHAYDSSTSPSNFGSQTPRTDYDSMRRSFSSTADFTPQSSFKFPLAAPNTEPVKRSMPPASPTAGRKRARLSLPGEDEAPTLKPSSSSFQLFAPAGLPADGHVDTASDLAAIEKWEKHNMTGRTYNNLPSNVDPQLTKDVLIDPILFEDNTALDNLFAEDTALSKPQSAQNATVSHSQTGNIPTRQHGAQSTGQTSTQQFDLGPVPEDLGDSMKSCGQGDNTSEPDWSLLNDEILQG